MKNTTTTKIQKQHEENSIKLQPKNKFVNEPTKKSYSPQTANQKPQEMMLWQPNSKEIHIQKEKNLEINFI